MATVSAKPGDDEGVGQTYGEASRKAVIRFLTFRCETELKLFLLRAGVKTPVHTRISHSEMWETTMPTSSHQHSENGRCRTA